MCGIKNFSPTTWSFPRTNGVNNNMPRTEPTKLKITSRVTNHLRLIPLIQNNCESNTAKTPQRRNKISAVKDTSSKRHRPAPVKFPLPRERHIPKSTIFSSAANSWHTHHESPKHPRKNFNTRETNENVDPRRMRSVSLHFIYQRLSLFLLLPYICTLHIGARRTRRESARCLRLCRTGTRSGSRAKLGKILAWPEKL